MNDRADTQRRNATAWLPPRVLRVGVTGHRPERLGEADFGKLSAEVARILDDIARVANLAGATQFRLVSPLAEGADSIVADQALARGWALDVVLPFYRDDYAKDFAEGAARDAHLERLSRAATVFELSGDREGEGGEGAAYEQAGRVALSQTDLLIAIWDGQPVWGRGGAAQVVAEAVLHGIPVIHIDPAERHFPVLLWDGLEEVDLGQQTIDTVARGDLARLDDLLRQLLDPPIERSEVSMLARFRSGVAGWRAIAPAYPLLLAIAGVRRLRRSDFGLDRGATGRSEIPECSGSTDFADRLDGVLLPSFARADTAATRFAQLFRSGYVTNFSLAAFAVLLSMLGLVLPKDLKPVLAVFEVLTVGTILAVTHAGNRFGWHRLWLDNRALAERLRCVALSAQLGDLDLRGSGDQAAPWVAWYTRAVARELGLPSVRADESYLSCVRKELRTLIDGQVAYLESEVRRMHHLDHRLHMTGSILFAITALACVAMVTLKFLHVLGEGEMERVADVVTIISAVLPAIGAAIYGIRMQGDFAGIAARSETLKHHLQTLRHVIDEDKLAFDTLRRRVRRVADLLAGELTSWLQTYHARPLALPG